MYVDVGFNIDSAHAQALIGRLAAKLTPPFMLAFMHAGVVPYIQGRIANRFSQEGDDVVGRWHPLKLETEILRARHGFPPAHPINVRTGQMRSYLTTDPGDVVSAGGLTNLKYPGGSSIGTELARKIQTAQAGTRFPPTVPRPVLGFNTQDSITLTALLSGHLMS